MPEENIPLRPEQILHIYNHAVGKENLFDRDSDYIYFIDKFKQRLLPVCQVYAYCLLPNHFHLVLRFKELELIKNYFIQSTKNKLIIERLSKQGDDFLSRQLSQFVLTPLKLLLHKLLCQQILLRSQ